MFKVLESISDNTQVCREGRLVDDRVGKGMTNGSYNGSYNGPPPRSTEEASSLTGSSGPLNGLLQSTGLGASDVDWDGKAEPGSAGGGGGGAVLQELGLDGNYLSSPGIHGPLRSLLKKNRYVLITITLTLTLGEGEGVTQGEGVTHGKSRGVGRS